MIAGIKTVSDTRCGDTITNHRPLRDSHARIQRSQTGGFFLYLPGGIRWL
jgi:translation elongation factor EF-4